MKNLNFLLLSVFMLIGLSTNATIYLVQKGGAGNAAWSASTVTSTGGTVVDLTTLGKSLNEWYNATFTVAAPAGTQMWVIGGTYVFNAYLSAQSNVSISGGFSGTETATADRAKPSNAKKWEFTNETIFDGNNAVSLIISNGARTGIIYDGFTVTKGVGYSVKLKGSEVMQNCILKNNTATTAISGVALVLNTGGSVKDCYFLNNSTSTIGTGGGAIDVYNLVNPQVIERCVFENNYANSNGSSLYLRTTVAVTVKNCLIKGSTGPTDIYINGNCNLYNNTIVNAGASTVTINGTPNVKMYNNVIWGASTNLSGGAASSVEVKNCAFMNAANASWTQSGNITLEATNTGTEPLKYYPNFKADYSLSSGSALINTGMTLAADVPTDFFGTNRPYDASYDIGYHEFNDKSTKINNTSKEDLLIYATAGILNIRNVTEKSKVSIYNLSGIEVKTLDLNQDTELSLAKGIYLVKLQSIKSNTSRVVVVN